MSLLVLPGKAPSLSKDYGLPVQSKRRATVDGTLDFNALEIREVPFIRFRKSLATKFPDRSVRSRKEAHQARERKPFLSLTVNASESF
jgi:hypothetical protein